MPSSFPWTLAAIAADRPRRTSGRLLQNSEKAALAEGLAAQSRIARMLLGSTTERVLRFARWPVLVVRP
jgi:nucleotide-binding universal stress UspA family protein